MFSKNDLFRLIFPLVIEQILAATIGIADTVMVSGVGEAAVSGVSLVDSINLLLINVFAALATGGAIIVAQYLGRKDVENANTAAKQLLLVTTVLSTVLMGLCLIGQHGILNLLFGSAEADVMEQALAYFAISALSYPFISVYNACAALFRAQGNSKISMAASFVMNVTNILGNTILIFGFRLGVVGAGISSLLSRLFGAVFLLVLLHKENNQVSVRNLRHWEIQPWMIKSILRIGIPNGLENGIFQIGKIIMQGLTASFGTAAIAANAMGNSIMVITTIPGQAIGLAMVTVVGHCVGAGKYKQAKRYTLLLTGIAYASVSAITLGIFIFLNPLVSAFGLSELAASTARQLCIVAGLGNFIFWPASFTLPNGLRAASDVRFTMLISVFSMWVFRVALSYLVGGYFGLGVVGIWICMVVDWIFRSIMFVWRLFSNKWIHRKLLA